MKIGGFQRFSLIDYPNKISSIIFTQGCNYRCPWCHNPELVYPNLFTTPLEEEVIFKFLRKRKGQLEAVEITGGEPTIQPDLIEFIKKIKEMDYLIKLDSNGSNPDVLEKIIKDKLVNYIAMDIKAPLEKYDLLTGVKVDLEKIKRSIKIIENSSLEYEFRTTYVPSFLNKTDISKIKELIKDKQRYRVQEFITPENNIKKKIKKEGKL